MTDLDHVTLPMSPEAGLQRSSGVHLEASARRDTGQMATAGAAARSLCTSLISARRRSPRFRRCGPSHYPEVFASTRMHKRKKIMQQGTSHVPYHSFSRLVLSHCLGGRDQVGEARCRLAYYAFSPVLPSLHFVARNVPKPQYGEFWLSARPRPRLLEPSG